MCPSMTLLKKKQPSDKKLTNTFRRSSANHPPPAQASTQFDSHGVSLVRMIITFVVDANLGPDLGWSVGHTDGERGEDLNAEGCDEASRVGRWLRDDQRSSQAEDLRRRKWSLEDLNSQYQCIS